MGRGNRGLGGAAAVVGIGMGWDWSSALGEAIGLVRGRGPVRGRFGRAGVFRDVLLYRVYLSTCATLGRLIGGKRAERSLALATYLVNFWPSFCG